ncbi:peptidoglycan-binding protein LysM [Cellulomonas chitinilytica]|uniref:Peptidoglycan-binding protein LysM n=1 Tax=Cellulomonas chitinilytica TaxID=398759 RepID=A0A919TY25_9CELL|nr:LysM peptidoglycan-binding domain-containing protein [Cellulomonas chitinilytica]GIG20135.1 peptidoglycan-binding protein LysM [Cellulomonas chitinilytica]
MGLLTTAVGLCGALAVVLVAHLTEVLSAARGPWRVDTLVDLGVSATGAVVVVWLGGSTLLALACLTARAAGATWRSGERVVLRCAPTVVRRALVLAVGAGLGLGVSTTAMAAEPTSGPPTATSVSASAGTDLDLGWTVTAPDGAAGPTATGSSEPAGARSGAAPAAVDSGTAAPSPTGAPDQPSPEPARDVEPPSAPSASAAAGAPAPAPTPTTHLLTTPVRPTADAGPGTVVVVRGDSLWRIAARHLSPGADDAQVAAAWPTWYAANADVIGPDPGALLPGQVLVVPATPTADGAHA